MSSKTDFQTKIESLDLSLFARIPSETSEADKKSLLALQRAIRNLLGGYVYLEIGSHLGGSIQSHLLDPRCRKIYSIDKRPYEQPDERGTVFKYPDNSTQRMLELLGQIGPSQLQKIVCFNDDSRNIDPCLIEDPPHLCFIDGEHTHSAVVSDFQFCLSVSAPNAVIAFHDSPIVYKGIKAIIKKLRRYRIQFTRVQLGGSIYMIALRDSRVVNDPNIQQLGKSANLFFLLCHFRLLSRKYLNFAKPFLRPLARRIFRYPSR